MKNNLLLMLIFILTNSCQSYLRSQTKKDIYQVIVNAFIEERNSQVKINPKENILIIGASESERFENSYWLEMSFVNPKLLTGFEYNKVYIIDGYRLIIDETKDSKNKSNILKKSFKETKYENLNLAAHPIEYDSNYWLITFDSKNEIINISPQRNSKEIQNILKNKRVKFSKYYIDNE